MSKETDKKSVPELEAEAGAERAKLADSLRRFENHLVTAVMPLRPTPARFAALADSSVVSSRATYGMLVECIALGFYLGQIASSLGNKNSKTDDA